MYKKNYLILTLLLILYPKQILCNQKIDPSINKLLQLTLDQIEKLKNNKKIEPKLKFAAINDFYQSLNNIEYVVDRPEVRNILDHYVLLNSNRKVHYIIRKAFKTQNVKSKL